MDVGSTYVMECSGIIDDGTGQAKLYAERDVAICLLGLSSTTVRTIETAIWETNRVNGYVYIKTTPSPSYLRTAVVEARALARQNIRHCGKDVRNMNDADVMQYLSQSHYGEYLFHWHCRTSLEPMRSLIYYVRCKPLPDIVTTNPLNQTEIDMVAFARGRCVGNYETPQPTTTTSTQSYTLPPISLNLVDCASPTD
jgi:hypothetical protein